MTPPAAGSRAEAMGGDRIRLVAAAGGRGRPAHRARRPLLDRRVAASFTGRVLGLYATEGTVTFTRFHAEGSDAQAL